MTAKSWGLAAAFAFAASLAMAAEPPTSSPDDARRQALAERYFRDLNFDAVMDATMKSMSTAMFEGVGKEDPNLPANFRQALSETMVETMHEIGPRMREKMTRAIAQTLTVEELTATVEFYESPVGRAIVAKQPAMAATVGAMMRGFLPDIQAMMKARLCAKIDCAALGKAKGAPAAN